jgi:hypothetical protein
MPVPLFNISTLKADCTLRLLREIAMLVVVAALLFFASLREAMARPIPAWHECF